MKNMIIVPVAVVVTGVYTLSLVVAVSAWSATGSERAFLGDQFLRAAEKGDAATVKALLSKGVNIELRDEYGYTALLLSAGNGHAAIVQTLIANKANIEERGGAGQNTPLMSASSGGHVGIVKTLLAAGADVNAQVPEEQGGDVGFSALMMAASREHIGVIKVLLAKGARIEMKNRNGMTALMLAALSGRNEAIRVLVDQGADLDARDNAGRTAVEHAQHERRTQWLLNQMREAREASPTPKPRRAKRTGSVPGIDKIDRAGPKAESALPDVGKMSAEELDAWLRRDRRK